MIVEYDTKVNAQTEGNIKGKWSVYPVEFPSYSRSIEEFAPKWKIIFEIEEEDEMITSNVILEEFDKIRTGVGYTPNNLYSDPIAIILNNSDNREKAIANMSFALQNPIDTISDHFTEFLPETGIGDFASLEDASRIAKTYSKLKGIV
jgi:hypothetical protein